jgi:hypothetical protein
MQMRRALAALALGSALALGGTAATAHAASPTAPAAPNVSADANTATTPGWHNIGVYATYAECQAAGKATGYERINCYYLPVPNFPVGWVLNVWY